MPGFVLVATAQVGGPSLAVGHALLAGMRPRPEPQRVSALMGYDRCRNPQLYLRPAWSALLSGVGLWARSMLGSGESGRPSLRHVLAVAPQGS